MGIGNAHSPAMVKHAMTIARDAMLHLNPHQVPLMAMDLSMYGKANLVVLVQYYAARLPIYCDGNAKHSA